MKLFALLLLVGCASASIYSQPPKVCSRTNVWAYRVDAYLEDNAGHSEYVGWIEPGAKKCVGWTLPGNLGNWAYVLLDARGEPTDIRRDKPFQAWALMSHTPDY